jgi:hypothetical protein
MHEQPPSVSPKQLRLTIFGGRKDHQFSLQQPDVNGTYVTVCTFYPTQWSFTTGSGSYYTAGPGHWTNLGFTNDYGATIDLQVGGYAESSIYGDGRYMYDVFSLTVPYDQNKPFRIVDETHTKAARTFERATRRLSGHGLMAVACSKMLGTTATASTSGMQGGSGFSDYISWTHPRVKRHSQIECTSRQRTSEPTEAAPLKLVGARPPSRRIYYGSEISPCSLGGVPRWGAAASLATTRSCWWATATWASKSPALARPHEPRGWILAIATLCLLPLGWRFAVRSLR